MLPIKNNLAPGGSTLAYRIIGDAEGIPTLVWDNKPRIVDANEVLGLSGKEKRERATRLREAAEWLRERLADGAVSQEQIERAAKAGRISCRTLRRAKLSLGVRSHKTGMVGSWYWELPEPGHEGDRNGSP